jgi:hypothetical protein
MVKEESTKTIDSSDDNSLVTDNVTTSSVDSGNADNSNGNSGNISGGDSKDTATELGEGETTFAFEVIFKGGKTEYYNIKTNETTVLAALLAVNLVECVPSDYGPMVKKISGVRADYDKDNAYWSFYIDGEYANTAADATDIDSDKVYSFKYEKA